MRTIEKTKQPDNNQPGIIIDPSLDALFAGKVLFPEKIAKIRKLYQNKAKQG